MRMRIEPEGEREEGMKGERIRMRMNGNCDMMDREYLIASHIKGPFEIYGHEIKVGLVTTVVFL